MGFLVVAWGIAACLAKFSRAALSLLVAGTLGFAAAAAGVEYRFARTPILPQRDWNAIYVIGDSISSGLGGAAETTWPKRLGQVLGRPVSNLAVAGATADSAVQRQLRQVTQPHSLVFVEIGGNDLLNGTEPEAYEASLRALLGELRQQNQTVVLFELPLLIWHRPYGRIQRQLAKEYGVILIRRTFLADIFSGPDLTSDSIHLTQHGHDVFAKTVYDLYIAP
jgi:lysophospholipase L1-like esterase